MFIYFVDYVGAEYGHNAGVIRSIGTIYRKMEVEFYV